MSARRNYLLVGHRSVAAACALVAAVLTMPAAEAAIISPGTVEVANPGDAALLCVDLELEAGDEVVGTDNELVWDGSCATLNTCSAAPAHGKRLTQTVDRANDTLTALIFNSADDNTLLPDGSLYCCTFSVDIELEDANKCCTVEVRSPRAVDPTRNLVTTTAGEAGMMCLRDPNATPTATPEATATAVQTELPLTPPTFAPTATAGATFTPVPKEQELNGCAIDSAGSAGWLPWLVAGAIVVARRRSRLARID